MSGSAGVDLYNVENQYQQSEKLKKGNQVTYSSKLFKKIHLQKKRKKNNQILVIRMKDMFK